MTVQRVSWVRLLVVVAAMGIVAAGCQKAGTIPIGAVISLTSAAGSNADGEGVRDGMQLAVDELNARGGLNQRKLELLVEDTRSTAEGATAAFDRMEKARHPLFFVTTLSNPSIALGPLAGQVQVPLFCLVSPSLKVTQASDWVYRYWPTVATYTPVYLGLLGKLGVKRLGIISLNDEFGTSLSALVSTELTKAGGTARVESFASGDTNHAQRVSRLQDTDAILFIGQIPHVVPVVDQIRASGYAGKLLANSPVIFPTIAKLPQIQGIYSAAPIIFKPGFVYARDLAQKFTARFGRDLDVAVATGYDLMQIVANLLEDQEISRSSLKARLQRGFVHSGVFGELRLGPGQPDMEMPLYPVQITGLIVQYQ